jgi:cytochrome c-type biogenesis protein
MNKKIIIFSIILLICIPVALSFGQYRPLFKQEKIAAPDFSLDDIQGKTFKLSSQRGNPVIIFFGATWCPACRGEMPHYKALYDKYAQRGLKFLYIDINESTRKVARFAKENSFPFLVLVDLDGSVANDYNLIGVPTLFLLDKEGNIISISHQVSDLSIDALFPAKK